MGAAFLNRHLFVPLAASLVAGWAHGQGPTPCAVGDMPANLQNGLAFFLPFCGNEDDAGSGAHQGLVNGATLTTDRFQNVDSAYSFNGTNSSINYGQVPEALGHDSLTICFWLKHQLHSGYQYDVVLSNAGLLGQGGCGYQCYIQNATGKLRFEYRYSPSATTANTLSWNTNVPVNTWTFYAVTYRTSGNLGVVYLYRNGVLDGSSSFTNPINYAGPGPFRVGTNIDTTLQRFYNGQIDDIMIYSRGLSIAEIGQIYNGFVGPVGVDELDGTNAISAYPNPVNDRLILDGPMDSRPAEVTLCDAYGRAVLRTRPASWPYAMDLGTLPPGCYMLSFDKGRARRLIKQ
jgi:hypothetical protein